MISKEDSGSKIDLEEIQESIDEEPIVNTDTQQEVVTPVEPDDISLPIRRTSSRVTMASPEAAKWKEAMKSEIQSMYDNQVWNLVDTTPSLKTVGCKWIFKKKTNMDGKVHTYKARLVVKGYTQTHMIDYEETFSPVAKSNSIRIMLAIAAFHDYEIWQMDVKTAFLNRKLIEDVFMAQPEGFENKKYPKRVCKLQKAIYGLKQASRSWNLCFYEKVTQFKMENFKKGNLPLHHVIKISKDLCPKTNEELDKMSRVTYASAIGSIMYAMTCTRPDISFALSMVSRHQQNPGEGYWTTVKNILKYLRNTKEIKYQFLNYVWRRRTQSDWLLDAKLQTDKDDNGDMEKFKARYSGRLHMRV
ncbi:retrotransposon protein, putative, ty1-copia subclass [Tanacetum coccineum]|uniref:Retrotransposon protein, putative, ty1-copia subclass n=1 Tax=Tanacetum coccineum TaxID=301880 RepID=A0ABQ4WGQ6_9ASTR